MNGSICQRRWNLLRDNFKALYFDNTRSGYEKDQIAPKLFYFKLLNLYKKYILSKIDMLKASEEFGKTTIDMESTMQSLLNNDNVIKVLSNINNDDVTGKQSQSQILLNQIKALPKNDVYIESFKTRIDPNTPFNKNYSYHTKQNPQTYTRTKLSMDDEEPKNAINKQKDITILYPNYIENNLDNCNLSNINHDDVSSCYIDNQTKSLNIPIDLEISTEPGPNREKYSDYQFLDNTTIEIMDDITEVTVENPAKKVKIEKKSIQVPSTPNYLYCYEEVKEDHNSKIVVRKPVKEVPVVQQPEPFPADWPVKFMIRYEADMKKLNNKMDLILRQISHNPRRVAPKREANEDNY